MNKINGRLMEINVKVKSAKRDININVPLGGGKINVHSALPPRVRE